MRLWKQQRRKAVAGPPEASNTDTTHAARKVRVFFVFRLPSVARSHRINQDARRRVEPIRDTFRGQSNAKQGTEAKAKRSPQAWHGSRKDAGRGKCVVAGHKSPTIRHGDDRNGGRKTIPDNAYDREETCQAAR